MYVHCPPENKLPNFTCDTSDKLKELLLSYLVTMF